MRPDCSGQTHRKVGAQSFRSKGKTYDSGVASGSADVGSTGAIVITRSDGFAQSSLPAFAIIVVQDASGSATVTLPRPVFLSCAYHKVLAQ